MDNDGAKHLADAVVALAVDDYKALKRAGSPQQMKINGQPVRTWEVKRFLRSRWCKQLMQIEDADFDLIGTIDRAMR